MYFYALIHDANSLLQNLIFLTESVQSSAVVIEVYCPLVTIGASYFYVEHTNSMKPDFLYLVSNMITLNCLPMTARALTNITPVLTFSL